MHVYQLIAENTVESKVVDIQERKKKLISEVCSPVYRRHVCAELMCSVQAFSGIKNATTQRQKREARIQGSLSSVILARNLPLTMVVLGWLL